MQHFEILGVIDVVAVIARGTSVREQRALVEQHGGRRWRKLKGHATVRLASGAVCRAEVHWYEAHGVGRRKMKIKRIVG